MSEQKLPRLGPDSLTDSDVADIVNLILDVGSYRTEADCARDIVRAVQHLQASHG